MSGNEDFYRTLFQLSRTLFLQQMTEGVLRHVVASLQELFPHAFNQLYMSQDTQTAEVPVLPLAFRRDGNDLSTRAFMEGRAVLGHPADDEGFTRAAAVPLIGRQGVYGVLEVRADAKSLSKGDVELLTAIGEVGGAAFENAKLYEQSNLLVTELRLVNEMTKRLNQSLRVADIFQYACEELIDVFRADFACILELDRARKQFVVQATNLDDMRNESFETDYGYVGMLQKTKEPIIVSDYRHTERIDSKLMKSTDSRSLIASPILVNDQVVGAVLVTHAAPNFFTYENYKLLLLLSGHIGLAIMKAQLHAELNRMVITDNLTGLYARRYLDEQVHLLQTKDARGSLIVVDIDNFKRVNDSYGHQIGDAILKQVSGIIRSCIRETDIAARWGGEELAIYLPQRSIDQTVRVAERIRERVELETDPKVTVSCGIAEWSQNDEKVSVETLFYKADMALYSAKHNGKNQYRIG
ncbi:sensor domain-containing diguanylate cyclase [Paenibacillus sp. TRM 82003]|nr:sensor domain-containing diguanylate cyclase [Paenibacillus sp. TRM 82003]